MEIEEHAVEASGFDGARLSGTLVLRAGVPARAPRGPQPPVVCLPGHTRPARTMLPFARALVARDDGPPVALLIDYRGRGRSAPRGDAALYTPRAEAQDLVSLLDALGWHDVDAVANGRGGLVAMASVGTRPGLMRRVVLGDIGPELDGVGLARLRASAARHTVPRTWDEATNVLRRERGPRFPALSDDDWAHWARCVWDERDGRPAPLVDDEVFAHFAAIDVGRRYPTLWPEFRALARAPLLLLRAEHSDILSDAVVERMRAVKPAMEVEDVPGQGHPPLLHLGDLPERIARFLAA